MPLTFRAKLIAAWGVLGVVLFLVQAIRRLAPIAVDAMTNPMSVTQWVVLFFWVVLNAFLEGYRGFQKSFAPRVVARAVHVGLHPRLWHVLLAPLFCMALFHARPNKLRAAWALLVGIVLLVAAVRLWMDQPWRGIVDAGVVVGLTWGTSAIVILFARAIFFDLVPPDDSLPTS
jgi:hypothetical protein